MKKILLLCILLIILYSCDPHDGRLKIKNTTDEIIFYTISDSNHFYDNSPLWIINKIDTNLEGSSKVNPNDIKTCLMPNNDGWLDYINEKCENKKLRIFFYTKDMILNRPWNEILKNQTYAKKIEYTLEELEKIKWEI